MILVRFKDAGDAEESVIYYSDDMAEHALQFIRDRKHRYPDCPIKLGYEETVNGHECLSNATPQESEPPRNVDTTLAPITSLSAAVSFLRAVLAKRKAAPPRAAFSNTAKLQP